MFCKVPFWSVQRGRESTLRMDVDQSCCCGSNVEQPSRIKAIPVFIKYIFYVFIICMYS